MAREASQIGIRVHRRGMQFKHLIRIRRDFVDQILKTANDVE